MSDLESIIADHIWWSNERQCSCQSADDSTYYQMKSLQYAQHLAEVITARFGIVPLKGVERVERISGGVEFDVDGETAAWVNGAMRTPHGYWNVRVGDDPTPAIAAMILAMREAQGES